jgi:hypothetical protein
LQPALIFFKRVRYHLSAAGLLPGARQSFCESLGYVINDAESHHGLPTFGRQKKSISQNESQFAWKSRTNSPIGFDIEI